MLLSCVCVEFHVTIEALEEIAALALVKNTGARGLRSILERVRLKKGGRGRMCVCEFS